MHKQHKAVEPEQMKGRKEGKPEETTHLTQKGKFRRYYNYHLVLV